jgi:hypothetical protein
VLSGLGILELDAPVGHAHGIEPTQDVGTALIVDEFSDLHCRRRGQAPILYIGVTGRRRYPLVGALFQAPLGDVANADDPDCTFT